MSGDRSIRQVFRPVYGEKCEVRPKHWWRPNERKAARLAAKIADHHADEVLAEVRRGMTYSILYGDRAEPNAEG